MLKLPVFNSKKLVKYLEEKDFICIRQKGSYKIFLNKKKNIYELYLIITKIYQKEFVIQY